MFPMNFYFSPVRAYLFGLIPTFLLMDRNNPLWAWVVVPALLGSFAAAMEVPIKQWDLSWRNLDRWVVKPPGGKPCRPPVSAKPASSRNPFYTPLDEFP